MPRAFDQINEHFFGAPRNSRRGVPNVVVVRPRVASDAGVPRSVSFRVDRNRPASLTFTTPKTHLAEEENFNIDTPSLHSQQISITENKDGEVEITIPEESGFSVAFAEAHMDGVHHLADTDEKIRKMWQILILIFFALAAYQIYNQIHMFFTTPIATNIEADYPTQINLPTIAICNNNQFRLTYLTGARVQNRKARNRTAEIKGVNDTSDNIFDKALMNSWDMDAVKFLRNAAHWKSRMILACTYPNGTRCRLTDFKAVWTLTGLCWAINTDPHNPVMITGAGPSHGLKLLLNIERYERIESCNSKFRTTSLPGLKILIYNQTDIPTSAMDGVNVPPGYTMDIPFRMQHRQKLPGYNCIQEEHKSSGEKLDQSQDARTCKIRNYLMEIERQCACSMRRAYDPNPKEDFPFCNVMDYFDCVVPVLRWGNNGGFNSFECMANCDEIDYIAWQDMNELPDNIFPKLIDSEDDEDESDIEEDENLDDEMYVDELRSEHFRCEDNQILEDHQVNRIKREAHRAYEKQTRYQEDILLRTKRLMARMLQAADKVRNLKWGWKNDDFSGVYERMVNDTSCFGNMSSLHPDIFNAINNKAARSEEKRAKMLVHLLNKGRFLKPESEFRTISDVKHVYGADEVDAQQVLIDFVEEYIHQLTTIYDEDSFTETLTRHLERMDRILQLMEQYDSGKLQRKAWAEKMKARNFLHFFEEDFYEGWYNVITRDLDVTIGKNVADLEAKVDSLREMTVNGTGLQIGSVLLFGDTAANHTRLFGDFIEDILSCTFGEVKNTSKDMSTEFKKVMHEFQSAYINLFKKELPQYLENFEFGPKFVKENFAHVNVFLHKMNVEHWKQSSTYSIWSLFCDVGGALGLFLGASLLTICDFVYIIFKKWFFKNKWTASKMEVMNRFTRSKWNHVRQASSRIRKSRSRRRQDSDSDDNQNEYELMVPVEDEIEEKGRRKIRFRPLKKFPGMIRRSFRKRFGNDKIQKVEEDDEDMDLTEIKPEDEKNKDPENHSISVAMSAPVDLSVRSSPSGISRETRSAPSVQDVVIEMEKSAEVEQRQKRSKSPSRSPFIGSVHESSNSPLPDTAFRFQSPAASETEPPRDPSPRKISEQPEDPMFQSVTEEKNNVRADRSKSRSLPADATVDLRKSPQIHFPSPPATDPPSESFP